MSTTLKEWLVKTITELEEERDAVPGVVNEDAAMALAAMKLALASLEAEAVGYFGRFDADDEDLIDQCSPNISGAFPLFAAPPAPVSVPLAIHDEDFEKALSVLNDTLDDCGDSERGLLLALDKVGIEVRSDARRAAMLQGAEPVTTAYKLPMQPLAIDAHGTLRFKENPIVRKLLDYATEHGYGLNEIALDEFEAEDQMQLAKLIGYSLSGYGSLSYVTDESYDRAAAAAPQQEVTQALAKGMERYGDAMQELAKKEVKS
ncbi:hypothetical protein ACVGX7_08915 [Enterobacter hormaechei]|uniref:hypothetical protein n=1 Tax=Enterobacter hormaechei TaxID=158836 RepID=UPI00159D50CF|nr:hypothetical protein [Enterobacter hormaechei]ELC6449177.1 hypothetical protein [Enterobacter hormaechei]ELC6462916.1 hypothetical protein [Enterobacter hormaechei]ELI8828355.1 hypothetical protein [Enterobacter hormaechei]ELT7764224.1 hypothetical protein [Enterobacter hormaechei]ELZ9368429.1 hypothetical protein [Enterobacter hormaechei]